MRIGYINLLVIFTCIGYSKIEITLACSLLAFVFLLRLIDSRLRRNMKLARYVGQLEIEKYD